MAEVALEHIRKTYPPDVHALRDLTLEIADGELMVLVGPSGCGKTTTLRLIAGLEKASDGTVRIGGRVVNDVPPRRRDVAMVFQRQALYPHLSVRQNLGFGLNVSRGWWPWLRAGPDQEKRIEQAAELLGLEGVLDRKPGQLSGGQQQRVALGRALVRQPAVFLLDEPLSHLDGRLRAELRRELHLLHRQLRATMVYVTHDPVEAMTLADRVAVLDEGTVQQVDRPLKVYQHPANRRVAEFFGWPPMNLIDGRVVTAHDGREFQATVGWLRVPAPMAEQPVTLGIRPEALQVLPDSGNIRRNGSPDLFRMNVALVETLGHGTLVTLERDRVRLTAWVDRQATTKDGQEVDVMIDREQVYWFDAAGRSILRGTG